MSKTVVYSEKAPEPIGPYSQAILVDQTLYVSGQIGIDREADRLVQDSIESETRQVMINLGHVLEAANLTFTDIAKCSIFVKNMDDFAKINGVYGEFFELDPPARETVEVSRLPKGVSVEISCIAIK